MSATLQYSTTFQNSQFRQSWMHAYIGIVVYTRYCYTCVLYYNMSTTFQNSQNRLPYNLAGQISHAIRIWNATRILQLQSFQLIAWIHEAFPTTGVTFPWRSSDVPVMFSFLFFCRAQNPWKIAQDATCKARLVYCTLWTCTRRHTGSSGIATSPVPLNVRPPKPDDLSKTHCTWYFVLGFLLLCCSVDLYFWVFCYDFHVSKGCREAYGKSLNARTGGASGLTKKWEIN